MAIEPLKIVRMDRDGRMMLAEPCAPCRDLVLGQAELVTQGYRLVFCRAHPAQRQVHPPQRLAPFDEGEALAHRHFERQPRQLVEHAGHGERGPVLDRNQRDEATLQMPRRRQLHRVAPEADAPGGQMVADIAMRDDHGPHRAVDEIGQEFERFGPHPVRAFIRDEQARIVGAQRRDQRVARIVERLLLARDQRGIALGCAREPAAHPVRDTDPALQGAAHDRQKQLVDVELLTRQPRAPALVEPLRELIRKGPIKLGIGAAADEMVVDRKARRADRAQHRIAQFGPVIELVAIRRLEQQSAQAQGLHQQTVARLDRVRVDMARIGQMRPRRHFARGHLGIAGQGR